MNSEAEREFLQGLRELTLKTGIAIAGCGCCGSPYLVEINKDSLTDDVRYGYGCADELTWISSPNQWGRENYRGNLFFRA